MTEPHRERDRIPLLISYHYKNAIPWADKAGDAALDFVLDSGAFSAFTKGTRIDHDAFIEFAKNQLQRSGTPCTEVFSLDVIGDHRASLRNVEKEWEEGLKSIPTYHVGEPESYLRHIAKTYPKIALGGSVGFKGRDEWAKACFSKVWPCRIHGLGVNSETIAKALPWDSIDATNWILTSKGFGRFSGANINATSKADFRGLETKDSPEFFGQEIEQTRRVERAGNSRWLSTRRRELGPDIPLFRNRLAIGGETFELDSFQYWYEHYA